MEYRRVNIPITGYDRYEIDTNGIVYNEDGQVVNQHKDSKGNYVISLTHNSEKRVSFCGVKECYKRKRRSFYMHILLAEIFLKDKKSDAARFVWHKNADLSDNSLDNLEWVTQSELWHYKKEAGMLESKSHARIGVKCTEPDGTEHYFTSIAKAGLFLSQQLGSMGVNTAHRVLVLRLSKNNGETIYKGYKFEYYDEPDEDVSVEAYDDMTEYESNRKFGKKIPVDIEVISTGKVIHFDSLSGAVRFLASYYKNISQSSFVTKIRRAFADNEAFEYNDVIVRKG